MKKLLIKLGLRILKKVLRNRKYRGMFVTYISEKVDIPGLSENMERKFFDSLYENLMDALIAMVDKIDL